MKNNYLNFDEIKNSIEINIKPEEISFNTQMSERGFFVSASSDGAALDSASAKLPFEFLKGDKIFLNGYQSWTLSKETGIKGYDSSMKRCPKFLDRKFGFSAYGDAHFYPKTYKSGVRHGYTYAYVRRGGTYIFFASLAESSGFTRIIFDSNENAVKFEKDCAGRRVDGEYTVFDIYVNVGSEKEVFDGWFDALGIKPLAAKKLTGYTSWYNYYQNISEDILLRDIEGIKSLSTKPDVFQIDDGYESAVGDWLKFDRTKFPNGLSRVVRSIKDAGCIPGIWLAPFVCEKNSDVYRRHSDWLARKKDGSLVYGGSNWSGMYALDFYNPEVQSYVRECIFELKGLGFSLFKLDFLYAVCMTPRPDKTRGEIMDDAMLFLREVCAESMIIGCGVPLAPAMGRVEFCRIGMDMTLSYDDVPYMRLFHSERPSTKNTMLNTLYRRQISGRAFINDPDVFLLRENNIKLTPEIKTSLAKLNCLLGGVLFTSDNFSDYSEETRALYGEVIKLKDADFLGFDFNEKTGKMTVGFMADGRRDSFEWKV